MKIQENAGKQDFGAKTTRRTNYKATVSWYPKYEVIFDTSHWNPIESRRTFSSKGYGQLVMMNCQRGHNRL